MRSGLCIRDDHFYFPWVVVTSLGERELSQAQYITAIIAISEKKGLLDWNTASQWPWSELVCSTLIMVQPLDRKWFYEIIDIGLESLKLIQDGLESIQKNKWKNMSLLNCLVLLHCSRSLIKSMIGKKFCVFGAPKGRTISHGMLTRFDKWTFNIFSYDSRVYFRHW